MDCYTYLRNVQDLLSDGKTPCERRFGKPFKGPIIPFGSLVEYYPITAKDQSRIRQFGKKVLPGLFHLIDLRRTVVLKERCAERRKEHLQYRCNLAWMKLLSERAQNKESTSAVLLQSGLVTNGGRIPWNVAATCETFKISCLMGRHPLKGSSEYRLKDQSFRLEQW